MAVSRITLDDLEDMLDLYGVRSPQREALIQLARDARRRGWWTAYSDVFTGSYIGLESEAATIKVNAHLVPGFLQTPDYARATITRTGPWLDASDVERRVAARDRPAAGPSSSRENPAEGPCRAGRGRTPPPGRRPGGDVRAARRPRRGQRPA